MPHCDLSGRSTNKTMPRQETGGAIVLHLPFPPSVNMIWRGRRHGTWTVYKSRKYKDWIRQAGLQWILQSRNMDKKEIHGKFNAKIVLAAPDKRIRDVDNYAKVLLDFAKTMRIIDDDRFCHKLISEWGNGQDAPMGCCLILEPHKP